MDRVDRGDAGRVWAEAARHAAEARAQELARALPPALEEGNPRGPEETGRILAEVSRLAPEARPAFFVSAASTFHAGTSDPAAAAESVRRRVDAAFRGGSERRMRLGAALVRLGGGEPQALAREVLEAKAAKVIAGLAQAVPGIGRPSPTASRDTMERARHLGPFDAQPAARPPAASAPPASPASAAPSPTAPVMAPAPSSVAPAPPAASARPAVTSGRATPASDRFEPGALSSALGVARTPGTLLTGAPSVPLRSAAREAAVGGRAAIRVARLPWDEHARGLMAPVAARLADKTALVAARVAKAREALWSPLDRDARVRYGVDLADSGFTRILGKAGALQDAATRLALARGPHLWSELRQARGDLVGIREEAAEAKESLQEVVGRATGRGVRVALDEVRKIDRVAHDVEQDLRLLGGRAAVLESAGHPALPAPEGTPPEVSGADAAAPEAATSPMAADFTEEDLARLGSALDPTKPPPQTLWNENQVNLLSTEGRKQGGLTEEQGGRNAELARSALAGSPGGGRVEVTAVDLAAVLKRSGLDLARVDPNQVVAATRYLNTATSLPDQQEKLRKVLDNFQVLDRIGLPKLPKEQLMGQLDTYGRIPGKVTFKLTESELRARFNEIAATLNGGGELKTKLGKYSVSLQVSGDGRLLQSKSDKPGFWSKVGGFLKKVTPIALTVLSFIPVTAPFARVAQGVISAVKAIKAKSILGVATAAAGIVAGAAASFGSKAMGAAAAGFKRIETIANSVARGLQGVSAIKQGNVLSGLANLGGAVASGIGSLAKQAGDSLGRWSRGLASTSDKLLKAATGVSAVREYQRAGREVATARETLTAARASGDPRAIADAMKRLEEAERAKKGALLSGLGSGVMMAADVAGRRRTPGTGQPQDRPAAASGVEAGLRAVSRGLSAAGGVATRDWESVGVNALGAAAALRSSQRPKEQAWQTPAQQEAAAELERILGRRTQTSTLNDLSNLADAGLSYRQAERAEQGASRAVAEAERVLQAARLSGDPAVIRQAEDQLRAARRGAEGALMGGIGASDALLGTARTIGDQHRLARAERTAVERLAEAITLKGLLEEAGGQSLLSPRDQAKATGLRTALEVLDRNYKAAVAAAAGDPRRLAQLNEQYADFLSAIEGEIPAVRVAAMHPEAYLAGTGQAPRSTLSPADQRRQAEIVLHNDRSRLEEDGEQAQKKFRAAQGWMPVDSEEWATRDAFRRTTDRLEAVLAANGPGAELEQALLEQHLARLAFDHARRPQRFEPDPLLAGLTGFLDEAGSRAFALVTLGGKVGIDRAMAEGRINAQSSPHAVFQAYLEGVFNGITFGGADAFVDARAGEAKGRGASLAEGFKQLGTSGLALEELGILSDPRRSSWQKAEAAASLMAKWAGLLAGGVAGGRAARARFEAWRTGPGVARITPKSGGKSPPYDPKGVAADLDSQYPGQVSSSTVPPPGSKNVGLAGVRHPSGVVFDQRGFPIFDDIAAFDTKLQSSVAGVKSRPLHFQEAARALSDAIQRGQVPASRFTAEQLRAIHSYQKKIPGLTWHHHQQPGRMQLIPTPVHQAVGHTGGFALWFE